MANLVSQPFVQVADRLLGAGFLSDITEFFGLFQTMEEGFVRHAREVEAQMAAPATRFVVVATAEVTPVHEARYLIAELTRRRMHLGGVVINRLTLRPVRIHSSAEGSDEGQESQSSQDFEEIVQRIRSELAVDAEMGEAPDVETVRSLLLQLEERAGEIAELAAYQEQLISELEILAPSVLRCPILDRDVHDLSDLAELAEHVTDLVTGVV
jgi:anion-transporting  ArsA/GET3 family ATPase